MQVEEAALSKEKDKASKERLEEVRKELAALQDELRPVMSRYSGERDRLQQLQRLRKKKDELQVTIFRLEVGIHNTEQAHQGDQGLRLHQRKRSHLRCWCGSKWRTTACERRA